VSFYTFDEYVVDTTGWLQLVLVHITEYFTQGSNKDDLITYCCPLIYQNSIVFFHMYSVLLTS